MRPDQDRSSNVIKVPTCLVYFGKVYFKATSVGLKVCGKSTLLIAKQILCAKLKNISFIY